MCWSFVALPERSHQCHEAGWFRDAPARRVFPDNRPMEAGVGERCTGAYQPRCYHSECCQVLEMLHFVFLHNLRVVETLFWRQPKCSTSRRYIVLKFALTTLHYTTKSLKLKLKVRLVCENGFWCFSMEC